MDQKLSDIIFFLKFISIQLSITIGVLIAIVLKLSK